MIIQNMRYTETQVKTATYSTTIAASLMVAVSASAIFFTYGVLAATTYLSIQRSTHIAVVTEEKIICKKIGIPMFGYKNSEIFTAKNLETSKNKIIENGKSLSAFESIESIKAKSFHNNLKFLEPTEKAVLKNDLENFKKEYLLGLRSEKFSEVKEISKDLKFRDWLTGASEGCLPQSVEAIEGEVQVLHGDNFDSGTSDTRTYLRDIKNKKIYVLYSEFFKKPLESGTRIKLQDSLVLDEEIFIDTKEKLEIVSYPEPKNPPVNGPYRIITFIAQPQTMPDPSTDRSTIVSGLNNLVDFYRLNSYGKMSLTGFQGEPVTSQDIYPNNSGAYKIQLPYTCTEDENVQCNPNNLNSCAGKGKCVLSCYPTDISRAMIAVADREIVFSDRARLVALIPKEMKCPYSGVAILGMVKIKTDDASEDLRMGVTAVVASQTDFIKLQNVVAHELSHTLYINHAMYASCQDNFQVPESCDFVEYGDPYDVMGRGELYHHNAVTKDYWGWLSPYTEKHKIVEVTKSDEGKTFYLSPIEDQEGALQAVKIPHGFDNNFLFVEYRQPMNLDEKINSTNVFEGALLHTGLIGMAYTLLFDPSISQATPLTRALDFNSQYFDPATGNTIAIDAPNADGFLPVNVKLGRYDFQGPTGLRMENEPTSDACKLKYKFFAQDENGISKVRVYVTDFYSNFSAPDAVVDLAQEPYTYEVDTTSFGQGHIWFEAFDGASSLGGNLPDNSSLSPMERIPLGCDVTPPTITLLSPEPHKNYPAGPIHFKLRVEDSQSPLLYTDVTVPSKDGVLPFPRINIYQYFSPNSIVKEKDIDVIQELSAGQYIIRFDASDIHSNLGDKTLFINVGEQCNNGADDDGDGKIDFPQDSGCSDAGDLSEKDDCSDGIDNDYDALIDSADVSCGEESGQMKLEKSSYYDCDNGLDDDLDGYSDYYRLDISQENSMSVESFSDPECSGPRDFFENEIFQSRGYQIISQFSNQVLALYAHDLDSDGEKEIVIVTTTSVFAYGKNQETGEYNVKKYQFTSLALESALAIGDIDSDGKIEILVNDFSLKKLFVLKVLPGVLDMQRFIVYPTTALLILGDINNDGNLDIPIVRNESLPSHIDFLSYDESAPNKLTKIFQFNFSESFGIIPEYHERYALGDVTGDGEDDLVMVKTGKGRGVVAISYDPVNTEGSSKASFSIPWPYDRVIGPVLGDIDGDGVNEVVLGNSEFIAAYRKGKTGENEIETVLRYDIAQDPLLKDAFLGDGLLLADIDFDSRPEIFTIVYDVGGEGDTDQLLIIARDENNPFRGKRYAVSPKGVRRLGPILDFNLDSKADIAVYLYKGEFFGFNNYSILSEKGNWGNSLNKFSEGGYWNIFPLAQDMDNNGKIELVFNVNSERRNNILRTASGFKVYESNFKSDKIMWPMKDFDVKNTKNFGTLVKSEAVAFKRGDVDGDGVLKITDPIRILDYLFIGLVKDLSCLDVADVNDDGAVNIADPIYLLDYLYSGTRPAPPDPFNSCGIDSTPKDNLGCSSFPVCVR